MFSYRLVIFVCVVAVGVRAGYGMIHACDRVSHGALQCCKKDIIGTENEEQAEPQRIEGIKECIQLRKEPPSCDMETCIAKKHGILLEDGTFDKEKVVEDIKQKFEANTELFDVLKDNCIFGDLSKYGPPDACDLTKRNTCFNVQILKSCDEWKEDGDCSRIKELVENCIQTAA